MVKQTKGMFNYHQVVHAIQHYLPAQMTLKDFIHHNTLHAFQSMRFYDGIFRASKLFGFKVTLQLDEYRQLFNLGRIKEDVIDRVIIEQKGETHLALWVHKLLYSQYDVNIAARVGTLRSQWKQHIKLDVDSLVHPLLYRILGAYLDQGMADWSFPKQPNQGFLDAFRALDRASSLSFFQTKKVRQILHDKNLSVHDLLHRIVGDETFYEAYLYDMCFSHRGWSGLVTMMEWHPNAMYDSKPITLDDVIYLELLLEWDRLEFQLGDSWSPISKLVVNPPMAYLAETPNTELDEVLRLWQDAFEWSYYDQVIYAIQHKRPEETPGALSSIPFQAIFCIDERECSLRRHIESLVPHVETFGAPGFFGVEFYYLAEGSQYKEKLCPVPVMPKHLVKETGRHYHEEKDNLLDTQSFSPLKGFFHSFIDAPKALFSMTRWLLNAPLTPANSNSFSQVAAQAKLSIEHVPGAPDEDGLQVGFTVPEMATRVETFLRNIGLISHFASIVYVVGHGSSTTNNPYYRAYDCGACSGRPGAVNSRVFSFMANHKAVRELLKEKGIFIPNETTFVPALHDTTADEIQYYDLDGLSENSLKHHQEYALNIESALDLNAKERSRRFAAIDTKAPINQIRKAIRKRANAFSEPRPELGHGTNSLAIIGRRAITHGLFLDRRAFLNSYNYQTDPEGDSLIRVMAPIGLVCGGINLEYYFSRVDNLKLGSGTKLAHSVNGLLGVSNSADGDLRPGLPWQMIEPHDPVRLLVVVEHHPHIVLKAIRANETVYEWYKNEWIHLVALDPESGEVFYFKEEQFVHYQVDSLDVKSVQDVHGLFEKAPEMLTAHITQSTFENLPIYQLESIEP
ncbi:MAG: YbcC family protein [Chitinophagaceae bacterium]